MASVNRSEVIGHLGRDPEFKTFANGGKICNLRVATTEAWRDKQTGERREATEWHSVSITNEALVGLAEKFLRKGSFVRLVGQLKTRKWQDQAGADRYSTEIVVTHYRGEMTLLDKKPADGGATDGGAGRAGGSHDAGGRGAATDLDDEIPF